jgi:formamidopyrimidine-DNA glycosylase
VVSVIADGCAVGADSEQFPAGWLFHRRWGKVAGKDANGHRLDFITVGGRTSCYVPALQVLGANRGDPELAPGAKGPKRKAKTAAGELLVAEAAAVAAVQAAALEVAIGKAAAAKKGKGKRVQKADSGEEAEEEAEWEEEGTGKRPKKVAVPRKRAPAPAGAAVAARATRSRVAH